MAKPASRTNRASRSRRHRSNNQRATNLRATRSRPCGEVLEARRLLAAEVINLATPADYYGPAGLGAWRIQQPIELAAVNETDTLNVPLSSGRTISLVARPGSETIQSRVQLLDASDNPLATFDAPAVGQSAILDRIPITADGTYKILVTALAGTGGVDVNLFESVSLQSESSVKDLSAEAILIGGGTGYVATGVTDGDEDVFSFPVSAGERIDVRSYGGPAFTLTDGLGNPLALSYNGGVSNWTADTSDTYFVTVEADVSEVEYGLSITRDLADGSHSGLASSATPIPGGSGDGFGLLSGGANATINVAIHAAQGGAEEDLLLAQLNDSTAATINAVLLTSSQMDTAAELAGYDVVLLGTPFEPLTVAAAEAVHDFYRAGGGVIATGWFAYSYRNESSSSTLGIHLDPTLPIDMDGNRVTTSGSVDIVPGHPITEGLDASINFSNSYLEYESLFEPDAIVLATQGGVTVSAAQEGEGRGVYLAPSYFEDSSSDPVLRSGQGDQLLEQAVIWAAGGNRVDSFAVQAIAGNVLDVSLSLADDGDPLPTNAAELLLELFYLDGGTPTVAVASSGPSAGGSVPSAIQYTVPAGEDGRYAAMLSSVGEGSAVYRINFAGGMPIDVAGTFTAMNSQLPAEGSVVNFSTDSLTLTFDAPLDLRDVDAADLTINGVDALGVQVHDATTVTFDVTGLFVPNGNIAVALASMTAVDGSTLEPFMRNFTIDTDPPNVTSITPTVTVNGTSATAVVEVVFDEPMFNVNVSGVSLVSVDRPNFISPSYTYDTATQTATYTFVGLRDGRFEMRLQSFGSNLVDEAGNALDGDDDGAPFGVVSTSFSVDFDPEISHSILAPLGASIEQVIADGVFNEADDVDSIAVPLEAGAIFSASVFAPAGADYTLELVNSADALVATGVVDGLQVRITDLSITTTDTYSLRLSSNGSLGNYFVDGIVGAGLEIEQGGGLNNSIATAEVPTMSPRSLAPGLMDSATSRVVSGEVGASLYVDSVTDIGFDPDFDKIPRAMTPALGTDFGGTADFLITDGDDVYSIDKNGVWGFEQSLDHFAHGLVVVDGEWLTVSSNDALLRFVDSTTGVTQSSIQINDPSGSEIYSGYSLAASPDGSVWIVYDSPNTNARAIGRLDTTTGQISEPTSTGEYISEIAFDAEGRLFVVVGSGGIARNTLRVYDPTTQAFIQIYAFGDSGNGPGESIAFANDGLLYRTSGRLNDLGEFSTQATTTTGDFQALDVREGGDSEDFYEVSMQAGQWLTLTSSLGGGELSLLNEAGDVLAVGTRRAGLRAIEGFIAAADQDVFVRVGNVGAPAGYQLVISLDANLRMPLIDGVPQPVPDSGVIYGQTGGGSGSGSVEFDVTSGIATTLIDGGNAGRPVGYRWDSQSDGRIGDGINDAYDGGMDLSGFSQDGLTASADGRSLRRTMDNYLSVTGLSVTRDLFVPTDDTFARFIDTFTNNSASSLTQTISYSTNLGSDGSESVLGTSSGDLIVTSDDNWIATDDSSATGGDPAVGHLIAGSNASVRPSSFAQPSGSVIWSYEITIPAGESVSLMSFAMQTYPRDAAVPIMERLAQLEDGSLQAFSVDPSQVVNFDLIGSGAFAFKIDDATALSIETLTPFGGVGLPANEADPRVLLYRDGVDDPVGEDDDSASDNRNALLELAIPAADVGGYSVSVLGSPSGQFVAVITSDPDAISISNSLTASVEEIVDGELRLTYPSELTIRTNAELRPDTVQAADLSVNGVPADSVQVIDGRTLVFDVGSGFTGDGDYDIVISSGSFASLNGVGVDAFASTFSLDGSGPRVIASNLIEGQSVAPGTLTYQIQFDEAIDEDKLSADDITIESASQVESLPVSLLYDPDAYIVTAIFEGLIETTYTLTVSSALDGITDLLGTPLDGDDPFPLPSGDGTPGGDFIVGFDVDTTDESMPVPVESVAPAGGRIYRSSVSALINAATDVDRFVLPVHGGQPITAIVNSQIDSAVTVEVVAVDGTVLGTANSTTAGAPAVVSVDVVSDTSYAFRISSADGTTGFYALDVVVGATSEVEFGGGAVNNTLPEAQTLTTVDVMPAADGAMTIGRAAVIGSGGDLDYFRIVTSAGVPLSIAANIPGDAAPRLRLIDSAGTTLAHGIPRPNNSVSDITEYVPAADGELFISVEAATDAEYTIVVLEGGAIDREPNDDESSAQVVQVSDVVIGGIAVGGGAAIVDFNDSVGAASLDEFTATGLWHITDACGADLNGGTGNQIAYFGIDSSCNFNAGAVSGSLVSPPLGLRPGVPASLELLYRFGGEGGTTYDRANVDVSTDGGDSWTTIASKADTFSQQTSWTPATIDLSSYAGQTVLIRFYFNSGDGIANTGLGWQLDDLRINGVSDVADLYAIELAAGDSLVAEISAVGDSTYQPAGDLDPSTQLINPTGFIVATGDEVLTYDVPSGQAGRYTLRVGGQGAGDYRLDISGASGDSDTTASLVAAVPTSGGSLADAPATLSLVLGEAVRVDSVDPSDLSFDRSGVTVTGVNMPDGRTLVFDLAIDAGLDGDFNYTITAGSIFDLQGTAAGELSGTFTIDRTGPRVSDTVPSGQTSSPFTTLTFVFDEPLDRDSVDAADILVFTNPDGADLRSTIQTVEVDGNEVTLTFTGQTLAGDYTLTIGGDITDEVGNLIDQNGDGVGGVAGEDEFTRVFSLQSPDLVAAVNEVTGELVFGGTVSIEYTVTNIGNDPAAENWLDAVYLSRNTILDRDDTLLLRTPVTPTLGPLGALGSADDTYTRTVDVTLPLTAVFDSGTYYLIVAADEGNRQPETNEDNNAGSSAAQVVSLPPIPDLVIEQIEIPASSLSGQEIPVRWRLANRGTGNFTGTINDQVRMSSDAAIGGDSFLANFSFTGTIPAGGFVERLQSVTLPIETEGDRWIVITADSQNQAFEHDDEGNNATISDPISVKLAPLPNLQVTLITPPTDARSSQTTSIDFVVTNTGTGPTSSPVWYDQVYLSTDGLLDAGDIYLGRFANPGFLVVGESYVQRVDVTLPRGIDGDFQIIVHTDSTNSVFEDDGEDDNITASSAFTVTLTPPPDLQVQSIAPVLSAFSGQLVDLSWTIVNEGTGRTAETSWWDDVYLSDDDQIGGDTYLGRVRHNGFLDPDQTYTASGQFRLPTGIEGDYYFMVRTDTFNNVYENVFESNNDGISATATNVNLTPPPDLVPTLDGVPTELDGGRSFSVTYTVANNGFTQTVSGGWQDELWLSADDVLDSGDIRLSAVSRGASLGPFQSYQHTFSSVLPWTLLEQDYRLIVVTDALDREFEVDNENNSVVSGPISLTTSPPDLAVAAVSAPSSVNAGSIVDFSWQVVNQGVGATNTSRIDQVVLSADGQYGNSDDFVLGTANVAAGSILAPGASQTISLNGLTIPLSIADGQYTLFVVADRNNRQFESDESDNVSVGVPITVTQMLSDLVVENATVNPESVVAGESVTVSWNVRNQGSAATELSYWVDRVRLISNANGAVINLGAASHNAVLASGAVVSKSVTVAVPAGLSGTYRIAIDVDADQRILESLESNNRKLVENANGGGGLDFVVDPQPNPDLVLTQVDAPEAVFSGQTIEVSWTVENSGEADLSSYWYDSVYLSADQVFDPNSDYYLGYRTYLTQSSGTLAIGQSYNRTATFDVPAGLSGPFYAFVQTDSSNRINEGGRELNNVGYDANPTTATLLPPADLVVGTINIPAGTDVGASVTLTYTVENIGTNPARGSWQDTLYLSSDDQLSLDDLPLGTVTHSGDVPGGGGSYTETLITTLPGVIAGDYRVIVRSDIRNAIFEIDETNNVSASLDEFAINLPVLELDVPATGQLGANDPRYWSIDLTAGDTVRFLLDQGSAAATGELFVKFGSLPDRGDFDFASNTPFVNDPDLVIPVERTGTYYVLAYGALPGTPADFSLLAEVIPLSVFDVNADTIGQDGLATVQIDGARFDEETVFSLIDPSDETIIAQAVSQYVINSVTAYATFGASDLPLGTYDLVATNEATTARMTQAVEVAETISGDVLVTIDGAPRVRPNRFNPFRVQYVNDGNVDVGAPLLVVENPQGLDLGFNSTETSTGAAHIFGGSRTGEMSTLRPGDLQSVSMTFRSSITGELSMPVRPYYSTNAQEITPAQWASIESAIRPFGLSQGDWASFWSRVRPRIGATWGAYVQFVQTLAVHTEDLDGVRRGDVRSMVAAIYEADPEWRPSSIISGRLVLADDVSGVSDVPVAAYAKSGGFERAVGTAVTDSEGNFTFVNLPEGDFNFAFQLDGFGFDNDRDGQLDNAPPVFTVGVEDRSDLEFSIMVIPEVTLQETAPTVAVDSAGVAHIVWLRDDQLWHAVSDGAGGWVDAQRIAGAIGGNPQLIAGDTLVDGGVGLMVTWRSGNANEAELFYALARRDDASGGYLWSTPEAITDDDVHDGEFDVAMAPDGLPVLVTQRFNAGNADSPSNDDADLYTWSQTPQGDFSAAMLAAAEAAIAADLAEIAELDPNDTSVRIRLQNIKLGPFTIPNAVPVIGGTYQLDFRGAATIRPSGCKAGGKIEAELKGKIGKNAEFNARGGGQVSYRGEGSKGNCQYVFDNAYAQGGGGAAVNIPLSKTLPVIGWLPFTVGVRLEAQGNANFGWDQSNPFPGWPEFGPGAVKGSAGLYAEGNASLPFLGSGKVLVRGLFNVNAKVTGGSLVPNGWGVTILARFEYEFLNYKRFKEFTFSWGDGDVGSSLLESFGSGVIDTTQIRALTVDSPDNFTVGIEPSDPGTLNDYGTSTLDIISQNLVGESRPELVTAPDGTVYGLWSNDSGVQVSRYDATADTWGLIGSVGSTAGLATSDATMSFTDDNSAIIVYAGQDLSGIDSSSTEAEIEATFAEGSDLFFVSFDAATDSFGTDSPLFSLSGNDSGISLLDLEDGDLLAVWNHSTETSGTLYSSRYDLATGTWSAAEAITGADGFSGRPEIRSIGGTPTVIYGEVVGLYNGGYNTDAPLVLRVATYDGTQWSVPTSFAPTESVSTGRMAASSSGDQAYVSPADEGGIVVTIQSDASGLWTAPTRISFGGIVDPADIAVTYDRAGTLITVFIESQAGGVSGQTTTRLIVASKPVGGQEAFNAVVLSVGTGAATDLRLDRTVEGDLVLSWIQGDGDGQASVRTATWNRSTRSFENASTLAVGVRSGSLGAATVAEDFMLTWESAESSASLTNHTVYAIRESGLWGLIQSADDLLKVGIQRDPRVDRETVNAAVFDQYQVAIAMLLTRQLGMGVIVSGAGVFLKTNGLLPFEPPEDCCNCDELKQRYVGKNEGCGSSTEVDEENCVRITTYKPCSEPPRDPNDILGPEGFGEEHWIPADLDLNYRIRFENAADAAAAASVVEVTQTLDDDLSLQTFQLKAFGFRGYQFEIPNAPPFFNKIYDLTEELGILVSFTAGINVANREAFWRLVAIDPATGLPPLDPDLGLLPPNDGDGIGEGFLDYTIRANADSPTGTVIDAEALIVFDTEEPIATPPIFNTLDAVAPETAVAPLADAPEGPGFEVAWSGTDDGDGSGLASYTVLVAVDGGTYTIWLEDVTETTATYSGEAGRTYEFVSIGFDNAGNAEGLPGTPDLTVVLPGGVATIGDTVWNDVNDNGLFDDGETGIDGVTIELFVDDGSANGTLLDSTVTSDGGRYNFAEVPTDGSYFLSITTPTGFGVGRPGQGDDTTIDSDFALDGRTAVFSPLLGDNLDFDAALVELGSISGVVWEDLNADGIRDAGENGLEGWTVYLDLNDDGLLGAEEPSTETASDGRYGFADLRPGTYVVAEVIEPGYEQTFPGDAGGNNVSRSYVQSFHSTAALQAPGLTLDSVTTVSGEGSSASGNPASEWIGLHEFSSTLTASLPLGAVVVIDTGIDVDHPMFGPDVDGDGVADRIVFQYDFADDDLDASDQTGHGSHVAGLIAGDDAIYAGVAPHAPIIALKVFGDDGRGEFADVQRALQWVIDNADVWQIDAVNLSIGDGLNWSSTIGGYGISDELAVLSGMGIVSVAAAGNANGLFNSPGLAYPAADPNTIAVGAVWDSNRGGPWSFGANGTDYSTAAGRVTSFSQRHEVYLDVLAPGAILTGANQYGGVTSMRGTSMAAPQVTGAVLYAQAVARESLGRNLTVPEIRTLLRSSGTRLVDGDDESDNVFNTGATFAGLDIQSLVDAVAAYDGNITGSGYPNVGNGDGGLGPSNGQAGRYVVHLAPGQDRDDVDFGNRLMVTPDVDAPVTSVTVVDTTDATLEVDFAGVDVGASGLDLVEVFVSIDGATATSIGQFNYASTNASITDSIGFDAIADGTVHTYRFFTIGTDAAGNVETAPTEPDDVTVMVAFDPPVVPQITDLRIDGPDPARSFIRSVEFDISDPIAAAAIAATLADAEGSNDRLTLRRYDVDGGGTPFVVPIEGIVSSDDHTVTITFGNEGISAAEHTAVGGSGAASSNHIGDGYYVLEIDLDGNTNNGNEALLTFYRLLGDTNGDLVVDGIDLQFAIDNLGAPAPNAGDVDGDGDVDVIDRIIISGCQGNQINPDLPITDPETLGGPRVTDFDVNRQQDQRSFVRYVDTELSSDVVVGEIADSIADADASNDRIELRRYEIDGSGNGEVIDLAGHLAATDRVLQLDFGTGGLGGNGNSLAADGYYALSIDLDGDGTFDAVRNFHRLLGDVTGDGRVNVIDRATVEVALRFGSNPDADTNGDGRVNVIDRIRVAQSITRSINSNLERDD